MDAMRYYTHEFTFAVMTSVRGVRQVSADTGFESLTVRRLLILLNTLEPAPVARILLQYTRDTCHAHAVTSGTSRRTAPRAR